MKKLNFVFFVLTALFLYSCARKMPSKEAAIPTTAKFVSDSAYIAANYFKKEFMIPMRDGVSLFTSVYIPRDTSQKYSVMFKRTPYSCRPYGESNFPAHLGPSDLFVKEKYIFVYQDVRGRFMSEGQFVNMRPHIDHKNDSTQIDESSDTYDTVDWLIKHLEYQNGKFGLYGISYPGFYAIAGVIDTHPAIKVSFPKCAISNWFFDDFHHHGTFFLPHFTLFYRYFGQPRLKTVKAWPNPTFIPDSKDGYSYFQHFEPLAIIKDSLFHGQIAFWDSIVNHPNYDKFWQRRNILPHLKNIHCAVFIVGSLFDAEDLYGPFHIYQAVEKNNPDIFNVLVEGPWVHGGMSRTDGTSLGDISFGNKDYPPSQYYQEKIEFAAAQHFLKDSASILDIAEATIFNTGENRWTEFNQWPPKNTEKAQLYVASDSVLSMEKPEEDYIYKYISNLKNPVPYTAETEMKMAKTYMIADQRFAAARKDVLHFSTAPLSTDITLAGSLTADLFVSLSRTDADFMVKLIDVYPDSWMPTEEDTIDLKNYQELIRSEAFRARFRKSYSQPVAFIPGKVEEVKIPLQDILHTFKKGHRIMIQIQSTWFPLVDLNPQNYVDNIFKAEKADFVSQEITVYASSGYPTAIHFSVLPEKL